jgi:hypothetical protein
MEQSRSPDSKIESKQLQYFTDQVGNNLVCCVRERVPASSTQPATFSMKLKFVSKSSLDEDLAGDLFHPYSHSGGLPVFDAYEGS